VQSVATRLVVERERERIAFRSASYWDVVGTFAPAGPGGGGPDATTGDFPARMVTVEGARVASGRDFDDRGALTPAARGAGVVHLDEAAASVLAEGLGTAAFAVRSVEEKPYTRRPAAPFTTSTLQQEASRKLRFSSRQTMRLAQTLYENGYITYMRTDSTNLSDQAVTAARRQAAELYGPEYVPTRPRVYPSRTKNAQEAHEAIRPSGDAFRTPAQVSAQLRGDEFRLYELIWKRTVASQMADALGSTATVRLGATAADGRDCEFSASGTVITFRGFLAAYEEGRDDDRTGRAGGDDEQRRLPALATGDPMAARELRADGHETSPPPRYTEASLIKALEDRGIGRPSTYEPTIRVIQDRGYVTTKGSAFVPTWLAFAVTRLLEEHFERLVDYDFTAEMEEDLDRIAAGQENRAHWLSRFYFDADGGLKPLVDDLGEIDARDINTIEVGDGIVLRVGRYGPYLEAPGTEGQEPRRASVPEEVAPDELTVEKARELLQTNADGDRELGVDPDTGRTVVARTGRFGPYVSEVVEEDGSSVRKGAPKPRTASLFKTMRLSTVTLADALRLLSLPRLVGTDPATGQEITAQNGRYGPYLKKGTDSRSLASEDQIFDIALDEALAIYAQPKQRGRAAASAPLRELGPDPASGAPVVVKDGRFGPYVTDGVTNATLRKDDVVGSITLERAAELLAEKRSRGPAKRGSRTPAKKTAAASTTRNTTRSATGRAAKRTPG
ncbi:MAG TPA: type I DNA topoisomerase, partial [Kineosporiaceae bacterium]|nr:type I DNA topoisomerase [Kineosporiaceae bacterium]